ncbi:unnamed protein product, partial [Didymodactylos carnosus]
MLFRIETVTERDDGIWQVELKLTNDEDKQLRHLTDRYREEIQGPTALHRLAILLCKMGEDRKAKEVYELLLGRTNEDDMEERAYIYNQLGIVCSAINNQEAALAHFKKSLELHLTYLSPDAPQLASCYSNIGQCLRNQGNFSETLEQYQRCLDIELSQPELDQDQRSIAMTHYNIGDLFLEHDCLDEALKSHERSLKLRLASLPPLHPDLAYSYGQIGSIFMNQGKWEYTGVDNDARKYSKQLQMNIKGAEQVLIKCRVQANPSAEVSWFKGRDKTRIASPNYERTSEGLKINKVDVSDNDIFWCRADVFETGESRDFSIAVIISIVCSMQHLNRSPPSPLQPSVIKKAKSLENTCDRNEMTDNNTLSQIIKDTFSTPVFIEQLCNSLVNSDVFLETIETIVASACKQQQEQIIELTVELDRTKSELEKVSSHLNDLKQYGKRKDLLIYGIPVKNDENLYTTVMELGNALGTKLNRNNFNAIHRLPAKRTGDKLKSTIISPMRLDRDRHGGGCQAYVRSDFHCIRLLEFENARFEILIMRLTLGNHLSVIILNVYRPQTLTVRQIDEQLHNVLEELNKSKYKKDYIIIAGDFNAHNKSWSMNNVDSTKDGVEFEEFLESENLFQLVRGVTREVSNTCLDLSITTNPSFIKDVVVQPKLDRSDHSIIKFKMNTLACKGRRVRTIYDYGAVNWEQVIARFLDMPVERLLKNYNSLNEKVQVFEEILLEHIKTYVPSKKIVIELRDKAWFNDELRVLYKKKLKLYRKRNNSAYHLQLYHEKAKKFKEACEYTKENYFKRINDKVCASSKNWWRLIKYKLGRERSTTIPALLIHESFETGVFPKCWKNGLITPVYKSGNALDRSNYRSITLLKALSKIPER